MAKRQKIENITTDIAGVVSEAFSAIEELKDELQNWLDNMPENTRNGDKASTLESSIGSLEGNGEPECPEGAEALQVTYRPGSKRRPSRADRRDEAVAMVSAACESVRDRINELGELEYKDGKLVNAEAANDDAPKDEGDRDGLVSDLESYADELEQAYTEWEAAEFPGLYG